MNVELDKREIQILENSLELLQAGIKYRIAKLPMEKDNVNNSELTILREMYNTSLGISKKINPPKKG